MSLRNKETLEKLFAESRERMAKRKKREAEHEKNLQKHLKKLDELEEKNWVKNFVKAIKNDSEWFYHWDTMDISIHSLEIISVLSNKKSLNDNEKKVLDFTLSLAYPNEFD